MTRDFRRRRYRNCYKSQTLEARSSPIANNPPVSAWRARRQARTREDLDNHGVLFVCGDDLQVTATLRAVLELDIENALEQPRKTWKPGEITLVN